MSKYEEQNDEGIGTLNTKTPRQGAHEHGNSTRLKSKPENNRLLGTPPAQGRARGADNPTGERSDRPVTSAIRVKSISIGATIPVMDYGNIQPKIDVESEDARAGIKEGMSIIREMFTQYGTRPLSEKDVSATVTLKSFNEDGVEVQFDPIAHVYTFKGTPLTGATTFIKRFYKEFDNERISAACANKWGVPQDEVKALWKFGGELTSDFGSLVHKTLEHYERHVHTGVKIAAVTGKDNPAKPKHPILRSIVDTFEALAKAEGSVMPEVLITDVKNGQCGQADRLLITGDKKCRVQDYKVNVDAEKVDKNNAAAAPFDTLPANKITKYQLQMSVYANMLQRSGWEVEGLDVYVYEAEWKHFALPVLNVC